VLLTGTQRVSIQKKQFEASSETLVLVGRIVFSVSAVSGYGGRELRRLARRFSWQRGRPLPRGSPKPSDQLICV